MDKPTTNWPSDWEAMAAEGLVVPDTKFPPDGEWHPEHAALQQAAGTSSAYEEFCRKRQEIEIEIRRYERRYRETRGPIAEHVAVALAKRIKKLHLPPTFDGREGLIKFRAKRRGAARELRKPPFWQLGIWASGHLDKGRLNNEAEEAEEAKQAPG